MPAPAPAVAPAATPAPAAAPKSSAAAAPPAAPSDDAIISEILKGGKSPAARERGDDDAEDTPAEPAADEAAAEADEGGEDEDDDAGHATEPSTEQDEGDAADAGDLPPLLSEARKALEDGDLDKAFELAFGKKPEEVQPDTKAWTKWRLANEKREAVHTKREQAQAVREQQATQWVEGQRQQLNGIIQQLRPYEEIQQARVAFKQSGDPALLVKLVELTAEMPYDEAQKLILTKTRRSPGERKLAEQVQGLMQKLEETERKRLEETQQQTQAQAYHGDLQIIRGQLAGEVTLVPRFAERVYKVLADTRTPTGLAMSVEEAGRRVLAAERRKLQKHPLLAKKPAPAVSQAASTLAKARKGKGAGAGPPLRRDSRSATAVDSSTETDDDIIADILKSKNRPRALV
jgi:hypothetical protein